MLAIVRIAIIKRDARRRAMVRLLADAPLALRQGNDLEVSRQPIDLPRKLAVGDRPFIRSLDVTIVPPAYTKLKREKLEENIGDVLVLPGTVIIWNIVPSKDISAATIVLKDRTVIPLRKNGDHYSGEFSAINPTSYYVELEDANGNTNQNIIEYTIDMLTDEFPSVVIVSPGKNIDVTDAMQLPMEIKIDDDFGISKLQLSFRVVESKYEKPGKSFGAIIPFDTANIKNGIVNYLWNLSLLGLVPEDVVEYYVEVQDNDVVNGPKTTKSQTYLIRLPSMEEVFAEADNTHDDALKTLEESLKDAQELKKDLDELSKDMKRNQQMDWQKQNKAEEALKKYEKIQKNIDNVSKTVDEMAQNLQQHNTLSKETLEKYMELQKTLSEMNSPEFQKAMKRMQEAMKNVSPDQLQEAMQQAQFNEEQFRQSIERTMNLLKRIQIEQKIDELLKRAEQMKQAQEKVNKETQQLQQSDSEKANELAQKQDEITTQLSEVQKELKDLEKKMGEFPKEMPTDKLNAAQEAANDKDMQNAMKQSSQQLRSQRMEQAMTAQQQANSGISEMQQQLSELQEQMLNNQMQQTMNALRKSMQDLLQLSQKQEALKNQSRSLDPNSQQFKEMAQQQQNLQGDLNNIANAMAELSQKSFAVSPEMGKQIGRAMGQMQQAMSGIEQRNGQSASASQNEAMASLNKAATQMQGAMKQMQQQGGQGGGSLMQQLRNMAMQQQQINAQTQQMGQQEGMSQQQMQEMGSCMQGNQNGKLHNSEMVGDFQEGESFNQGAGSGGPGRSGGGRGPEEEAASYKLSKEKANVKTQKGQIISSRLVWGEQVKGESVAEFSDAVERGQNAAAEAFETMRVHREYQGAVKHYFGRLEAEAKKAKGGPSAPAQAPKDAAPAPDANSAKPK